MKKLFQVILALVIIGLVGYFIFKIITYLFHLFSLLNHQISATIITGSLTIFGSVLSIIIAKNFERKKETEQQHRMHKIPIYESLIETIFNIMNLTKTGKEVNQEELVEFFNDFTRKLIVWGSDEVIIEYRKFRQFSYNLADNHEVDPAITNAKMFEILESLLLKIRKDTGHKNKKMDKGTLLGLFINDIDDYIKK